MKEENNNIKKQKICDNRNLQKADKSWKPFIKIQRNVISEIFN